MRIDLSYFFTKDKDGNYDQNNVYNMINLLANISDITGRKVRVIGKELQLGPKSEDGGGSELAASFLQDVIEDDGVVSIVNAYKSEVNPDAETGVAPGSNELQMNFKQSEDFQERAVDVGVDPLNASAGMTFFHELVHTEIGARKAGRDWEAFDHRKDGRSDYQPGRTVAFVNRIRRQLRLRERLNYYRSKVNPHLIYSRGGTSFPSRGRVKVPR